MKQTLPVLLCLIFMFTSFVTRAQDFDTPVSYMEYISKQQLNINKKFLAYASASAHSKRNKKVETLRSKLLDEVQDARVNINGMPSYKGEKAYRDTAVSFMKLYYHVLNEDYSKIVNMEDVAEQSYDAMEAYMLAKEMAEQKLDEGNQKFREAQKTFATANNITLLANKSEMETMMSQFGEVNKYYKEIYLIFFKPYKQEVYLMEALDKANITGIEQNKNALQKYAQEGLEKLAAMKGFKGDNNLLNSCKRQLEFYVKEADKINIASEYFLTKERFESIKKEFDAGGKSSKEAVDNFNKAVKDINKASQAFNDNNNQLNKLRSETLNNWNNASDQYFDSHSPTYN